MNEGFIENELIIITKQTFDKLLAQKNGSDMVALYLTYYSIAKWQGTNQIYSTTAFTAQKLKWAESKVRRIKKDLSALGLIEDITKRSESGKVLRHYIKVNYIFTAEHTATLNSSHTMDEPQCGLTHSMAEPETNALRSNNINALSGNNKNALRNQIEILSAEFSELWKLYPRKVGKDNAFKSYCKARKDGVSKETVEAGINRYNEYIRASNTNPNYIKHGSTWFNQRCWEDDYDTGIPQAPEPEIDQRYNIVCEAIE